MNHVSRVLAAVDFSKPARDAFDYALALSRRHGAELFVIQAVPTDQSFARHARARLALTEKLRHRAEQARVECSARVQTGDPAEIVLLHARSLTPDLIVLGTHQRRGLERFRMGSVAERVAASATVPVLLVPRRARAGVLGRFRHVVVAVDFSAASNGAVAHALTLANDAADRITFVHVLPQSSSSVPLHLYGYGMDEHQADLALDVRRRLQRAVPATRESPAAVDVLVLRGDPATEISQIVERIGADLLVVGATRRSAVSRALFGTTAARLLRATPVPMLAIPHAATANANEDSTALQRAA